MKKIFFIFSFVFCALFSNAQTDKQKIQVLSNEAATNGINLPTELQFKLLDVLNSTQTGSFKLINNVQFLGDGDGVVSVNNAVFISVLNTSDTQSITMTSGTVENVIPAGSPVLSFPNVNNVVHKNMTFSVGVGGSYVLIYQTKITN